MFTEVNQKKIKSSRKGYVSGTYFKFWPTPTESTAGGTMLHLSNGLSYKPPNDLNMYKK